MYKVNIGFKSGRLYSFDTDKKGKDNIKNLLKSWRNVLTLFNKGQNTSENIRFSFRKSEVEFIEVTELSHKTDSEKKGDVKNGKN